MKSNLEDLLGQQIELNELPAPSAQYKFLEDRKFMADFAWPNKKVICEVEGGTFAGKPCRVCGMRRGGRHNSGVGFENDCKKYNLAALKGWRVFRFTSSMIKKGEAIETLRRVLR
jgi:very-short-patch-repair endonuclease